MSTPNKVRKLLTRPLSLMVGALFMLSVNQVHALDVDAGDYVPLPPGTNLALLYMQYAERDNLYSRGKKVPGNNGLDSEIGIFRAVHYMDIGGLTVDPQILLPFGRLKGRGDLADPLGEASGIADPILAATIWVQNNPEAKTYTGITPYLFVPIGSYNNNRVLNLGENRWAAALQVAHVRPVVENVSLDLVGDITVFGKNDELGPDKDTLKQDPLYQVQGFLRYHLSPTADVRAGVAHSFGGETKVNGDAQRDEVSTTKFSVGGSFFIGPSFQVLAMVGQDTSVRNGFKESTRVNVRLLQVF